MLEVKEDRWLGRFDDGSPKVKWMRRVYPLVDYTQAPWTVVICLGSRAKASTLRGRHTRFAGGSVFHTYFHGLLSLLAIQQKWYHHLQQQVVQVWFHIITITYTRYNIYAGVPSKLSSLYLFEYCCFHPNSGRAHPDIVHRNRKRSLLSQSTPREEFVEKSAR